MKGKNITHIIDDGLCTGCGICAGVCPRNCIQMKCQGGITVPVLTETECTACGMCMEVCPAMFEYCDWLPDKTDFWMGPLESLIKAQTLDSNLLEQAGSGGVVTTLVQAMLDSKEWDCSFLVNTYSHKNVTESEKITKDDSFTNTPKSRYVTVSHERAIRYILENPNEKVILVATPCVVHGLLQVIEKYKLNREHYFIIGLFCDKTMTNNVYTYFEQHPASENQLAAIHFRDKNVGGWPGGIRLILQDGSHRDLPNTERKIVKEYFQPECCLYCLDKLNIFADISVGDNYIYANHDKNGISSVMIRTQKAVRIWKQHEENFVCSPDDKEKFLKSQVIVLRKKNLAYATLKSLPNVLSSDVHTPDIDDKIKEEYKEKLRKISLGNTNPSYHSIQEDIRINGSGR